MGLEYKMCMLAPQRQKAFTTFQITKPIPLIGLKSLTCTYFHKKKSRPIQVQVNVPHKKSVLHK